jgi:hypothetical protein
MIWGGGLIANDKHVKTLFSESDWNLFPVGVGIRTMMLGKRLSLFFKSTEWLEDNSKPKMVLCWVVGLTTNVKNVKT